MDKDVSMDALKEAQQEKGENNSRSNLKKQLLGIFQNEGIYGPSETKY